MVTMDMLPQNDQSRWRLQWYVSHLPDDPVARADRLARDMAEGKISLPDAVNLGYPLAIPDNPQLVHRAWHVLEGSGRLAFGDNRTVRAGVTYAAPEGYISLCRSGMHACEQPLDTLANRQHPVFCRVSVWGDVEREGYKLVGRYRHVHWLVDASPVLTAAALHLLDETLRLIAAEPDNLRTGHLAMDVMVANAHRARAIATSPAHQRRLASGKDDAYEAFSVMTLIAADALLRSNAARTLYAMWEGYREFMESAVYGGRTAWMRNTEMREALNEQLSTGLYGLREAQEKSATPG